MGKKAKRGIKKKLEKSNTFNSVIKSDGKTAHKPRWKMVFASLVSLIALLLGYDGLWPKVIVDSSPATDGGFLSSQFTFANQPCYPVHVKSTAVFIVNLSFPSGGERNFDFQNIGVQNDYDNLQIGGRDSVTIKIDGLFQFGKIRDLKEGSKIVIRATYVLPVVGLKKSDLSVFEVAHDTGGNPIWIKKPIGIYSDYANKAAMIHFQPPVMNN